MLVSVIIPTYHRPQLLAGAFASLKEQEFSDYEIIVVDNACLEAVKKFVEKEIEIAKTEKYSIRYVQEPGVGLHNARHRGAKEAHGEILVFLDDDLIADRNFLSEIYKVFKENPQAGWAGGKVLPRFETDPPEWINLFPKWYLSLYDAGEEMKEVPRIYGSTRRDLLFQLGGFNPDAFGDKKMWWMRGDGEMGLLRKVQDAGYKVIYNPKAILWHFIPKTRLTMEYFKERSFKSGVETSFAQYRYSNKPLNSLEIFIHAVGFGMCCLAHAFLAQIPRKSKIRHKVVSCFYKARFLYGLKLITDNPLRNYLKTESWLCE